MIPTDLVGGAFWLPLAFVMMMGLAMLLYVVLDGYDLGVGMLLPGAKSEAERDTMISAIGPFWDANETWLVLGVGILLVAFPLAHGVILTNLYLPVTFMLAGLILRGVAFDFRVKARVRHKHRWDRAFFCGSALAAFSQGVMLGQLVSGFDGAPMGWLFSAGIGVGVMGGYCLLGAGWLVLKTEGRLQAAAVRWARGALVLSAFGIAAVSVATPFMSESIFDKWFSVETLFALLPIPLMSAAVVALLFVFLTRLGQDTVGGNTRGIERWAWAPFAGAVALFVLAFMGLAYSLFPYLVLDRITVWEAASAPESLAIMFWGAIIVVPTILAYTVFLYRVFGGKAQPLRYDG
ncbi:cytochrome d ubiquinol oxidase subunit II [Polycyclovorans algicola]|uniref:cytochrome d ubiquinol oxidase subunit II n=1 Tax=Polycyclovorans algicola TaxID=616992 RepID=UPI0004A782BE|nr:cytochrome d ubiquinol oxidase subunit II [Polycyclovorans algicola]